MGIIEVKSPFTGAVLRELRLDHWSDIEAKLVDALTVFENPDCHLKPYQRIAILEKLAVWVEQNLDHLVMQIAHEGGKPLKDAKVEVLRAVNGIRLAINELFHLKGSEIPMGLTDASTGRRAYTLLQPRGVVVAISAFNHPLNLIIHQVIPAIAVGAPILIKPALETPLSCLSLVEALYQAGLPEAWCQWIICTNEDAKRLASDARISFVSFIGSARVGWQLRSNLAPGVRCSLEHGGSAPLIIDADVNLETIVPMVGKGAFYHAGQVCVSTQRVYVHRSLYGNFCDLFTRHVRGLKVGDPTAEQTDIGPLIRASDVDRVDQWVQEALGQGAQCLLGGKRHTLRQCYESTILTDVPESTKAMQEEIFGPVVCINSFNEIDDAICLANHPRFQFQSALFTQHVTHAEKAVEQLQAQTVLINDHTAFRIDGMPFAGGKQSGLGTGGIGYTMRDYCYEKLAVWNHNV
ncbi:MAG: aldehyde dehydrogenase family protein [Alphaproteobacteria bacterium]|nr:aldehyde dehydrogenase family protein [Alphaproteobacteria bacterium]